MNNKVQGEFTGLWKQKSGEGSIDESAHPVQD